MNSIPITSPDPGSPSEKIDVLLMPLLSIEQNDRCERRADQYENGNKRFPAFHDRTGLVLETFDLNFPVPFCE